ncbi:DNA-binding response regulator, NarL/FixJ family, contains REC and HTH domains [Nitrosospira briensis]|uniref:DNA-binding response regulator, NarL/FixJ family, contains REC and HTH domains n=1 Tax=Nitrosospira briensis TaxID=35799 RepID=A0A1I5A7L6_9PROT|nr:response regulator transcription factor [Nitrosospira briensis]SFN58541.1 DNA-binding response regulator, NarL/FixJ family, contains REC and HTH domains [Nitrosospira briensis]
MSNKEPVHILIVDDHPMLVQGLSDGLSTVPNFNVVAAANTLAEARELAQSTTLHLAIIDLFLPDGNGINLAMEFGTNYPDVPLLIYTSNNDPRVVTEARNAGARGYLLKGADLQRLILAVEVVLAGGIYLDRDLPKSKRIEPAPKLTPTEDKVMRRFARWMTNKEVSKDLNIKLVTVRCHRTNIMWKLGLYNTPQLYREAIKRYGNPDDPNYIWVDL